MRLIHKIYEVDPLGIRDALVLCSSRQKGNFYQKKQLNQELVDLTCEIEGLYAACDCMTIEVESLKRTETFK